MAKTKSFAASLGLIGTLLHASPAAGTRQATAMEGDPGGGAGAILPIAAWQFAQPD